MAAGATNFDIYVNGDHVPDDHFVSFVVDRDVNQPDMCSVVLSNQASFYTSKVKIAQALKIDVGKDKKTIWEGEIVGIEPQFKGGGKTTVLLRGMNKLHQLIRRRKSLTFSDKSDKEILQTVLSGMSLDFKHQKAESIKYKNVYQHNQSDLEFLRTRAGRIGAHVWCVDQKVMVKFPDFQEDSGIKLSVDPSSDGIGLTAFLPRMNSATVVKKVTVNGWNPETKELITAVSEAKGSKLGSTNAATGAGDHGKEESFTVDHPIWSQEEAQVLADARLMEASLNYIVGEAETKGSPQFDLGQVITVDVSASGKKDPFSGKYYVMGITHRHSAQSKDGFVTVLRLARDAQDA